MAKRVICINKYIVIHEVFSARIVRRIYVNQIDFAFVCFFQKFEACQIIAFDKEVHLSTVVDEKPCIFRQYGKIIFKYFVNAFAVLDQIEVIRICTRAPVSNPKRITDRLARLLAKSGKVWANVHINTAAEVAICRAAAAKLVNRGVPVSSQTVLLKGVNDTPAKMLKLLQALSAARIRPYYVFQCDPVEGLDRFRVSLDRAKRIERYCAERIGGLALPRFVADLPGAKRKTPLDLL